MTSIMIVSAKSALSATVGTAGNRLSKRASRRSQLAASLLAVSLAALASASAAMATASVTNRDEKDHKITIIEGEKKKEYTLKPNEELKDICASGCVLRLNDSDDDEYELEARDIVSIEDGALFYDNQDAEPEDKKAEEPKKK